VIGDNMADQKLKDEMKFKLTEAVKSEIKKDKTQKTINSVQVDDGIITARFSVRMPKEKEGKGDSSEMIMGGDTTYEDFTKSFKTSDEFNKFVWDEFFNDFETT
jgi:hypothetical protein